MMYELIVGTMTSLFPFPTKTDCLISPRRGNAEPFPCDHAMSAVTCALIVASETAGSRSGREFTRSQHRCAAARLSSEGENNRKRYSSRPRIGRQET